MPDPTSADFNQPLARLQPVAHAQHVALVRPPGLSSAPDAMTLLTALRRRWKLAFGMAFALAALAGAAAWILVPKAKYTASATLLVATNPKRIIFEPRDNRSDYRTFQRTQVALVKNRKIIAEAIRDPGIAKLETVTEQVDAEEWLEQHLRVDFAGGSEVLEVSLSGDRPEDLAKIVNAVVKSYMTLVVDAERRDRLVRLEKLKKLWQKYQEDLDTKRKGLRELVANVGSSDKKSLAMAQQFKAEHLAMAQKEQMTAQSELLKAQAALAVVEAKFQAAESTPSEAMINEQVERSEVIARKQETVNVLARRYQETRRVTRGDGDPALVAVLNQWRPAAKELEALRAKERQAVIEHYSEQQRRQAAAALGAATQQVGVWKAYREALAKDIGQLETDSREIATQSMDVETEQSEISIADDTARKVGAEVEAVGVELDAPERVEKLGEAKVPMKKDELRQYKLSAGAALGAFTSVLLGVSFWEFRSRRINTVDEVVNGLGIKLVGALPAMPGLSLGRRAPNALEGQRWQRLLVESVDATRATLLHASRLEGLRVVMVSSAVSGEGKTTLSCHLATSLARAGRRTLLIDFDLRNPSVHRLFNTSAGPGVCELLRGEARVDEVVQGTQAEGLFLIPAGQCNSLALQALSRDDLRPLLDSLKELYDFVIVDSAPILLVADSLQIGQYVDAVIFSVLRDVSRLPLVYSAYEKLSALGVRMLGAVVTGIQSEAYNPRYPGTVSDQ